MRRILCICLALFMLLAVPARAYGDDWLEYELREQEITISIPAQYTVFTRDMDEDDPAFSLYGVDKESMLASMISSNSYLSGTEEDFSHELSLVVRESPIADLNELSQVDLENLTAALKEKYNSHGLEVYKTDQYPHPQVPFIRMYLRSAGEDSSTHSVQYLTVYNEQSVTFVMYSYLGEITAQYDASMEEMVDSIVFGAVSQALVSGRAETQAFSYTDPETNISFDVPANWVEISPPPGPEAENAVFTSLEGELLIVYLGTDTWSTLRNAAGHNYSRRDVNNSMLSTDYIAEMYSLPPADVWEVTYGGRDYFAMTIRDGMQIAGQLVTEPVTMVEMLDNGYLHIFVFSGTEDSALYGDFEALMSSVQIEEAAEEAEEAEEEKPSGLEAGALLGKISVAIFLSIWIELCPQFSPLFF